MNASRFPIISPVFKYEALCIPRVSGTTKHLLKSTSTQKFYSGVAGAICTRVFQCRQC
jgi:hypothetical protein